MNIHITKINGFARESTAQVAQHMVADMARELGFIEMGIYSYDDTGESEASLNSRFDGIIASVSNGDAVIFQFPTWHTIEYDSKLIDHIRLYGGRIIIFVHDVIALMFENNRYLLPAIIEQLNKAEVLIVPSVQMQRFLQEQGVHEKMKYVIQEIWDCTTSIRFYEKPQFQKIIHFAGSPDKFRFPNEWGYHVPLKLYSQEPGTGTNVQPQGWMTPDRLLLELSKGGFGLVWYGDEYLHQYMKYNCNFKLSTYLAAGIPAIVPEGISNQGLIEKNHLGLVVKSLDEAVERVNCMTEQEYQKYTERIKDFAFLLREGFFTKKLLVEAVHTLLREE